MSTHRFTFRRLVAVLGLAQVLSGCVAVVRPVPPPPAGERSLEGWSHRHPAASQALGDWVRGHPRAAERFFRWDGAHPGAAESFVVWSIRNPGASIDVFAVEHPRWEDFNWVMEHHRPAANAFMVWCRQYPAAAEELMHHPAGLHWAGTHLYQVG
jgi:hypothetical protein